MTLSLHTTSREETIQLGQKIGSKLKKGDILAMQGKCHIGNAPSLSIATIFSFNLVVTGKTG